ncbi:AAA family ATPase [Antrihabitans sp. YC3-6]|uniref:AAA family ATPase n=1 Tax=Antrihabitans stalagmiti TaxID=2799499 RepID=A0A934NNA6_9NOCA|nr:AAA domain-containing protein [Antrihabitans stalagmiti]MBJ8338285.1 AAA family ATPase [Antrihabitans stalagmiti]
MDDLKYQVFLILGKDGKFEEKTSEIDHYRVDAEGVHVRFRGSAKTFAYGAQRIAILRSPVQVPLDGIRVEIDGKVIGDVSGVLCFDNPAGTWWRIFASDSPANSFSTFPGPRVRILRDEAALAPRAAAILNYWRSIVEILGDDDPLAWPYGRLRSVHPESVLSRYLNAEPIVPSGFPAPRIFPFSSNLSQSDAVENALLYPISVIDGPPGTGKTQTILNVIANILGDADATVGVVSFNNAAVANVGEKLKEEGFGYIVASLGNKENKEAFFASRNEGTGDPDRPSTEIGPESNIQLMEVNARMRRLQVVDRDRALRRHELKAYLLEQRHFLEHLDRHQVPALADIPLLRRSSERILDFLADAEMAAYYDGPVGRVVRRIRGYFRYGRTGGMNPADTDVLLQLQRIYYEKRVDELAQQIAVAERTLSSANFARDREEQGQLSTAMFRNALRLRYADTEWVEYKADDYKHRFAQFSKAHPVILSTCHSLANSIGSGKLLDYLIIDEASQVNLLAAGLALASARNVIVVGDERQLPHIVDQTVAATPPYSAYDYVRHNILSSLLELYGNTLPRTMLREHYRCDPMIIEFCNKKFYGGQMIPFTTSSCTQPLLVMSTVAGNHMRHHREGGKSNQREVDVIQQEVIPQQFAGVSPDRIGVTAAYRRQVGKLGDALDNLDVDTVHKFQGRQKDIVIMSAVIDESKQGNIGTKFVDDAHLVNVAVSRAVERFVLVTNHGKLRRTRNLRDLVDYIEYRDPTATLKSDVISVFDLLYRDYSARLAPLAARLKRVTNYDSENIVWTVLQDLFAESPYSDFYAHNNVKLRHLVHSLDGLTVEERSYVRHGASLDFVVFNRTSNRVAFSIEVDGFLFHEDRPEQLLRDRRKDAICAARGLNLLRLPTTGSGEERLIRERFDNVIYDEDTASAN